MDAVLRAAAIYLALMVLFRISGRRALGEMTSFDFVLLLIIGEATQQALLGDDFSITNAVLVIVTLLSIDIGFSLLKRRSKRIGKLIDGGPTIIVENGVFLRHRMHEARVQEDDVMQAARLGPGVESVDQIKFAIIERNGKISIIRNE
ncbi:YetF domain-containing protein [Pseudomonas putida]|jgi:uncharacterized membrane protein YcaP (DUF421 family)|uniref:DUF421 domain-containing protein n=1 Tax=Pseudomonas TaxID=286 RepID=UPI002363547E|nr:YetF domain-containing protein [Pseudomonas putida]MDD1967494.1 DUF421 domain-containing protein [Pseudomonas putida]